MEHTSLLYLLILTLIAGTQSSHFRGGTISWTSTPGSLSVSFTMTAYWAPSNVTFYAVSLQFLPGVTQTVNIPVCGSGNTDYITTKGVFNYTYPAYGNYIVSFQDCCRLVTMKAGINDAYRVYTQVNLAANQDAQSGTLSVPPILDFGVGYNVFPVFASYPVTKWAFSLSSESGLVVGFSTITGNLNRLSKPSIGPSTSGQATIGSLNWNTTAADLGMWPISIKATTAYGVICADFIIRINSFTANGYTSVKVIPVQPAYTPYPQFSCLPGGSISFKLQCVGTSSYYLSTPTLFDGLQLGASGTSNSLTVSGTDQTLVTYTPRIHNPLAESESSVLTFYCRDIVTCYTTFYSLTVYVAQPLVLTIPPPQTLGCHPTCGCLDESVLGTANATDACCGVPTVTYVDSSADGSCNVKIYRNWTASNTCGQTASATQIITINDDTPPVVSACEDENYQCYTDIDPTSPPTAYDTCGSVTLDFTDSGNQGNCNLKFTRTWTATDDCQNVATANQNVYVNDTTPPYLTINTENPLSVSCPCDIGIFDSIVIAIDNCDGVIPTKYTDSAKVTCGKWVRTWTATDLCGNPASYSLNLEVGNTNLPTFYPPDTSYYSSQCYADTKKVPPPTAKSYCGTQLVVTMLSEKQDNATCCKLVTRVWSATDECGNTATYTQTIPVKDNTMPTFKIPKDFTVECAGVYTPDVTGYPTCIEDNCGISIKPWYVDTAPTGACSDCISRTWYIQDNCGNVYSSVQKIYITDTKAPTYKAPSDYTGVCPPDASKAPKPSSVADCHKATTTSVDKIVSQQYGCTDMVINRTWSFSDTCYHTSTYTQQIFITDKVPPCVTFPCDTTVECYPKSYPNVTGTPHATDNCGVAVTDITYINTLFKDSTGAITKIIRLWTVKDVCGNKVQKNQTILLNNSIPYLSCPADVDYQCLTNYVPKVAGYAIAVDACEGNLVPTFSDQIVSSCTLTGTGYTPYTHVVRTWSVVDSVTGKSAQCTQNIYIGRYKPGPTILSPGDRSVQCTADVYPDNNGEPCVTPVCPEDIVTAPVYDDTPNSYSQCANLFSFTRTWTVTDQCGLSSSASQTIRIHDATAPVLSLPSDCYTTCRLDTGIDHCCSATATDNCNGTDNKLTVTSSDSITPSASVCPPAIYRTWTATDCSGNTVSGIQTITINETGPAFVGTWTNYQQIATVACANCATPPTLTAVDTCGTAVPVTLVVTKTGTCPTKLILTYTATDSCGRQAVLVLYILVSDTVAPVINSGYSNVETNVECENQIPVGGVVTANDNCDGTIVPTFKDLTLDNCTCDSCSRTIIRTWTAVDSCGNSACWTQTINLRKTKSPILSLPKDTTIACGAPYSADYTGTGVATATDYCGGRLYVTHTDLTTTTYGGAMTIVRTWTTVDDCQHYASGNQTITIQADNYIKPYTFTCPPAEQLPCGTNVFANTEYPSGQSYSDYNYPLYLSGSCGVMTVDVSISAGRTFTCSVGGNAAYLAQCPDLPGHYTRTFDAKRNGVSIGNTLSQDINTDACPPTGSGIYNVPLTAQKIPTESIITPTVTIIDADLPCEVFTVVWSWGDGTSDTYVCNPEKLDATHCQLAAQNQMTTWCTHNYFTAGVFTISVTISGQRQVGTPDTSTDFGTTYVRFWASYTTYDAYAGSALGSVAIIQGSSDDDQVSGYGTYTCAQPWIVKSYNLDPTTYKNVLADKDCGGIVTLKFAASFTETNTTVKATGDTYLDWDSCGIEFEGTLDHLSLFADGVSALWIGEGTYINTIACTYSLYAVDGGGPQSYIGDKIHIRITETATGIVLFDTDPCMVISSDYTVQPTTSPNSILDSSSAGFTIMNPTGQQVSALASDDYLARNGIPVGLIVGIVIGLLLFTVLVAGVVYFLLTRTGKADDTFIKMT